MRNDYSQVPSCRIPVTDPTLPLAYPTLLETTTPLEIEIGCGKGRFLTSRAAKNPDVAYLGIERMLDRVRKFDGKVRRAGLKNIHILRLEAFYTFYYLIPAHRVQTVYVFFPDPWPKRKHHRNRLFSPTFLDALWHGLVVGGKLELATDHADYFEFAKKCVAQDPRFRAVAPMTRAPEEQTEFETLFRGQGLPIYACAFETLPAPEKELPPLELTPDMIPVLERGENDDDHAADD